MSEATIPYRLANGPGNLPDADKWMANYDWLTAILFGSFIFNGGLENWSQATSFSSPTAGTGVADYWAALNSGTSGATFTIARESSTIDSGAYSAKINITVAGSSDSIAGFSQGIANATRFQSLTVLFGMKVKTSTTNKVRLKIYDGTTTSYSSYHDGDGSWQLLQVPLTVAAAATAITVYLEVTSDFTGAVYVDSGYMYSVPASMNTAARALLGFSTLVDPVQTAGLNKWRKPNLVWVSVTSVDVEEGYYDGVTGTATMIFPDGDVRIASNDTHKRMVITQNAALTGTKQGGLRSGLSEATNTWYSIYAVKSDDGQWVTVGDTLEPKIANYATLNSNFGTNSWVYLGLIRNGDNGSHTGDILAFRQAGNIVMFNNAEVSGSVFNSAGLLLVNSAGTVTATYTYSSGTGTTDLPSQIKIGYLSWAVAASAAAKIEATDQVTGNVGRGASYGGGESQQFIWTDATVGLKVTTSGATSTAKTIWLSGFADNNLTPGGNPYF